MNKIEYRTYLESEHWQQVRQSALQRAKHRCQLCNSSEQLNVHHRTYVRLRAELPDDVIVLCRNCHGEFHAKLELSREPEKVKVGYSAFRYYRSAAEFTKLHAVDIDGKSIRITMGVKLVAWALASYADSKTGQCNPYQATLAAATGQSLSSVERAIKILKQLGWISVDHTWGNRALYQLLTPTLVNSESEI